MNRFFQRKSLTWWSKYEPKLKPHLDPNLKQTQGMESVVSSPITVRGGVQDADDFIGLASPVHRISTNLIHSLHEASARDSVRQTFLLFEVLSESADSGLFRAKTQNPGHVLHRLLPPKKPTTYNMRKRTHNFFCIPQRTTNLNNRNFLERMLYKNSYWSQQ